MSHDARCWSLVHDESGCDCAVWAMIDASDDLRQWVHNAYGDGPVSWWRYYARADEQERSELRLLAAVQGADLASGANG